MNDLIETGIDASSNKQKSSSNKKEKSISWKRYINIRNVCFLMTAILVVVCALITINTIREGSEAVKDAFEDQKQKTADEVYKDFYQDSYDKAYKKNMVTNSVTIEVESIKEEAQLEVLEVSDVEYITKSKGENEAGAEVWMEYYGDGVFTVNMQQSEFVIDANRQYVLVRAPKPVLSNCRIVETNELLWKDGVINESYSVGADLAVEMRNDGYTKLSEYMNNAMFYENAESSARILISHLVKGLNTQLPNLVVEVEFF